MWRINNTYDWAALRAAFSWIRDMEGVPQDEIYHAEGDVAIHTKMVMEALIASPEYQQCTEQEQHCLFAAALLHDVEKRSTTVHEPDGRISSKGHARKGEYTSRQILFQYLSTPFPLREMITKLVRYHGFPLWVFEKEDPKKALLKVSLEVNTKLLAILTKADVAGRICQDQEDLFYKVELFEAFCKEQNCWGKAKEFPSDLGRYLYFSKEDGSLDYEPYEKDAFDVILLAALPGMGKDFFIENNYRDWEQVSLDQLRRKNKVLPTNKKGNGQMIQLAKENARVFLRKKQPFIWNATNITRNIRGPLIELFQSYGAKVKIVYLEVPFKQWQKQNQNRQYPVPTKVLDKMMAKLEPPALWEAPIVDIRAS